MRDSSSFWIRPNGIGGYEFSSPRDRTAEEYVPARERDVLAASLQDVRIAASIFAPNFSREVERRTADPTASLARLKAQWQAEALEELAEVPKKWWPGELLIEANKRRRQAEGGGV